MKRKHPNNKLPEDELIPLVYSDSSDTDSLLNINNVESYFRDRNIEIPQLDNIITQMKQENVQKEPKEDNNNEQNITLTQQTSTSGIQDIKVYKDEVPSKKNKISRSARRRLHRKEKLVQSKKSEPPKKDKKPIQNEPGTSEMSKKNELRYQIHQKSCIPVKKNTDVSICNFSASVMLKKICEAEKKNQKKELHIKPDNKKWNYSVYDYEALEAFIEQLAPGETIEVTINCKEFVHMHGDYVPVKHYFQNTRVVRIVKTSLLDSPNPILPLPVALYPAKTTFKKTKTPKKIIKGIEDLLKIKPFIDLALRVIQVEEDFEKVKTKTMQLKEKMDQLTNKYQENSSEKQEPQRKTKEYRSVGAQTESITIIEIKDELEAETIVENEDESEAETILLDEYVQTVEFLIKKIVENEDKLETETIVENEDESEAETILLDEYIQTVELQTETIVENEEESEAETIVEDEDGQTELQTETIVKNEEESEAETIFENGDESEAETMVENEDELEAETIVENGDESEAETIFENGDESEAETIVLDEDVQTVELETETIVANKHEPQVEMIVQTKKLQTETHVENKDVQPVESQTEMIVENKNVGTIELQTETVVEHEDVQTIEPSRNQEKVNSDKNIVMKVACDYSRRNVTLCDEEFNIRQIAASINVAKARRRKIPKTPGIYLPLDTSPNRSYHKILCFQDPKEQLKHFAQQKSETNIDKESTKKIKINLKTGEKSLLAPNQTDAEVDECVTKILKQLKQRANKYKDVVTEQPKPNSIQREITTIHEIATLHEITKKIAKNCVIGAKKQFITPQQKVDTGEKIDYRVVIAQHKKEILNKLFLHEFCTCKTIVIDRAVPHLCVKGHRLCFSKNENVSNNDVATAAAEWSYLLKMGNRQDDTYYEKLLASNSIQNAMTLLKYVEDEFIANGITASSIPALRIESDREYEVDENDPAVVEESVSAHKPQNSKRLSQLQKKRK